MDYLDFMWAKLIALAVLAFFWGLYRGITGQPLVRGQRDSQTDPTQTKR
jgi:hypothetical protein